MSSYYVDSAGQKDGPHDLVTIMRRIRSGKVTKTTLIYIGDNATATPAAQVPDIALFFQDGSQQEQRDHYAPPSLLELIARGWQLLTEHHFITVYSGGLVLLSMMIASGLINTFGWLTGGMFSWVWFVTLHNVYLLFILRLQRGQSIGSDFINNHLAPVLITMLAASIVLGLMMTGGLLLLVIPGILVAVMYIFTPFLILDQRYSITEALYASRLLVQKHRKRYGNLLFTLASLHFLGLLLVAPIPLTLPIFAYALSELYEELCTG